MEVQFLGEGPGIVSAYAMHLKGGKTPHRQSMARIVGRPDFQEVVQAEVDGFYGDPDSFPDLQRPDGGGRGGLPEA